MGRRTGFLSADIYQGAGIAIWRSMSRLFPSFSEDGSLFFFPGGRLSYTDGDENIKNGIYALAGSSLDEAVVWASTLTGAATDDEVRGFIRNLASRIPVSLIGMEMDGIPSVIFDGYSGMYSLVSHFIETHGERRIAFIRGPEEHTGAEERYRAYCDALSDHGIAFDPVLVSPPEPWDAGKKAVKELIHKRNLVPGVDFTSLIAASDLLLSSAVLHLDDMGVRMPEGIKAGGFNDTDDNLRLRTSLSTVRLPSEEISAKALELLSSSVRTGEVRAVSVNTFPVIRNSCGCRGHIPPERLSERLGHEAFDAAMGVIRAMDSCDDINAPLSRFLLLSGDAEALMDAVSERADAAVLYRAMVTEERRAEVESRIRLRSIEHILDSFRSGLRAAVSYEKISPLMASFFPSLGIEKGFLVLYKDRRHSVLRAGFSSGTLYSTPVVFSRGRLLPSSADDEISSGIYIVEPLSHGRDELGYLILDARNVESYVAENLRSVFSSAMKSLGLLEDVRSAKEAAERSEHDALTFYSRVSEEVLQPLSAIRELISSGTEDRKGVLKELGEAEHILRLALGERMGMSTDSRMISFSLFIEDLSNMGYIVSSFQELPAVHTDRKLLVELMSLFLPYTADRKLKVSFSARNVSISAAVSGADSESTSMLLAGRIALLLGVELSLGSDTVAISIPYPVLGAADDDGSTAEGDGVLFLSDDPDAVIPEVIRDICSQGGEPCAIAWREGRADPGEIIRQSGKPLICFLSHDEAVSVEAAVYSGSSLIVLGDTELPESMSSVHVIRVKSAEDVSGTEGAGLVVIPDGDAGMIRSVRSFAGFSSIPVLVLKDDFSEKDVKTLLSLPSVLVMNPAMLESPDVVSRIISVMNGGELLPVYTAAFVRKSVAYMNMKASSTLTRWEIADAVGLNEDYFTRIFHREMGISPWEYLGRYRIWKAENLLVTTKMSISAVAEASGFQDQAYFSRVFKKIRGVSPARIRKHQLPGPRADELS